MMAFSRNCQEINPRMPYPDHWLRYFLPVSMVSFPSMCSVKFKMSELCLTIWACTIVIMINPAEMCQSPSLADFSPKIQTTAQKSLLYTQLPIAHPGGQLFLSLPRFEVQPEKPQDQHRPMAVSFAAMVAGRPSSGISGSNITRWRWHESSFTPQGKG